jgi:hypothetical protein
MIFIDGDFKTGMGNCPYHCSPTCHPGQIDPDRWRYGCTHKAWPQNKEHDFVPLVECGGDKSKCEMIGQRFLANYKRGKSCSLTYAKRKVDRLEKELKEIEELMNK